MPTLLGRRGGGQIKQFMSVFEQKNSDALVVAGGNGSVLEVRVQVGGGGGWGADQAVYVSV